ncbi:MAG TPA: tetratricopeptide repeat protein [Pseudolabrys sp.]|nr:tetratricopeptide repeat protein [Pseudolabrys sp.]
MSGQPSKLALALNRAIATYQAGQPGEAEQICQKIIAKKSNFFDAHHVLGIIQAAQGKNEQALTSYNRALAVQPNHADTLSNCGNVLTALRRFEEALASYNRALAARPNHTGALNNRGVALQEMGRHGEALASFAQAIALQADYADALCNRGNSLHALGRFDEALASYDCAIALRPALLQAHCNRGNTLRELQRYDEALASYDRALALQPNLVEAIANRGITLAELKRHDEALDSFARALALRPDDAELFNKRGVILDAVKRHGEALADYDRALALRPDYTDALYNRGNALHELKRFDEALACYDRLLPLRPNDGNTFTNRGKILKELDRYDEALACSARALELLPDNIIAHCNEASMRLLTGDFARGFAEYEWRWKKADMAPARRDFPQPMWRGEDIAGKTILLHGEQGFGDAIHFCRYAPLVAARGAHVILEVRKPLARLMDSLMHTLAGPSAIVASGEALPAFDLHCPLLSLPLAMGTRLDTIPAQVPYLGVPAEKAAEWSARLESRLGTKPRPRIGLAWSGSVHHELDKQRSIGLRNFARLLEIDATFISLHKEAAADDARVLAERSEIVHFGEALDDYTDTAALISQLDLVVSVDTSVVHLAGALAKPVWVLVTYVPDWRWLLGREDSPWYPTARVFRQSAAREWDSVITRVHGELGEFVKGA